MTAILFFSSFLAVMGYLLGRCFKGLNPFLIFFGLMVFLFPVGIVLLDSQQDMYFIPFGIGFLYSYGNPLRWLIDGIAEAKLSYQLAKAKRANQSQFAEGKQKADEYYQEQAEDIQRQKAEAEAEIRKEAEKLRREKEAFKNQQSSYNPSDQGLNPLDFQDACKILGVHAGSSLNEFKKAYRHLSALFHPDKFAHFDGVLKSQAAENFKLINSAWETVKRKVASK